MSDPIPLGDLPASTVARLGLKVPKSKSGKVASWKDVPSTWGICREHDVTWFPKDYGCMLCEGDE